jgi:hypothetical protein
MVMIPFQDTSDEMLGKATFSDFLALDTSRDTIGIHPYTHQNQLLDQFVPHGPRTIMNGFNYQSLSIPLLQYTVDELNKYITKLGDDYVTSIILFEGYPHGKVCEIPCDATAFPIRTSSFRTAMAVRWKGKQHDEWVGQWVKEFVDGAQLIDKTLSAQKCMFVQGKSGYANFVSPETKVTDVFAENFARMKEVKRKWDPMGRFNKWFNPCTPPK